MKELLSTQHTTVTSAEEASKHFSNLDRELEALSAGEGPPPVWFERKVALYDARHLVFDHSTTSDEKYIYCKTEISVVMSPVALRVTTDLERPPAVADASALASNIPPGAREGAGSSVERRNDRK